MATNGDLCRLDLGLLKLTYPAYLGSPNHVKITTFSHRVTWPNGTDIVVVNYDVHVFRIRGLINGEIVVSLMFDETKILAKATPKHVNTFQLIAV